MERAVNAYCRIAVTAVDSTVQQLAVYGIEEAFVRLGLPVTVSFAAPEPGVIVYGPRPDGWTGATLPFNASCYNPASAFAVTSDGLWAPSGHEPGTAVDLVGGLVRLLLLFDESQVADAARNSRGIFNTQALPAGRRAAAAAPLVERHVQALRAALPQAGPGLPLWPNGRRMAVVVTHDTDAAGLRAGSEVLFNLAKAILRRDPVRAQMVREGLRRDGADPFFGFDAWSEAENTLGLRSAFYLYSRNKVRAELNDCRSTVFNRPIDWSKLRALADDGWEFGLHPPIRAKDDIDEFLLGKAAVEEKLGRPIYGLRHHYWALDWRQPHLTFRKHVNAGFRYDTSIAWSDAAGFRAGTCLPYRPFDPGRQRSLPMYQLPTSVMDGHVIFDPADVDGAVERALVVSRAIREVGGVLVLDWHTETAANAFCYANYRTILVKILSALMEAGDCWFATPWQVVGHWHQRRRALGWEL